MLNLPQAFLATATHLKRISLPLVSFPGSEDERLVHLRGFVHRAEAAGVEVIMIDCAPKDVAALLAMAETQWLNVVPVFGCLE